MIHPLLRTFAFLAVLMFCFGCGTTAEINVKEFKEVTELVQLHYNGAESPLNLVKEVRFYQSGSKKSVTPLIEGKVHGKVEYYYPSGYLKESMTFSNGVQDGVYRSFDAEGVLVFEGIMKNGLKQGKWTTWYDEVQRSEERTYLDDQLHGEWTFWYIDGSVKRVEVYDHGTITEQTEY